MVSSSHLAALRHECVRVARCRDALDVERLEGRVLWNEVLAPRRPSRARRVVDSCGGGVVDNRETTVG